MLTRRSAALLLGAATLAACAKTETPEQAAARMQAESDAARQAIEQLAASFAAHLNAGHPDSVAALFYTSDATLMPPNMPAAQGHDAIRATLAGMMEGATVNLQATVQSVAANGPLAVERGRYHLTMTPAGGPAVADSGKYLARWQRQADGSWKMAEDIWNSDAPLPPPPPTRRR